MSFFRLFEVDVFIAQKGVFSFQDIIKNICLAYIALKKKGGKLAIFGPNLWVHPLETCQSFDFFNLFFLAQKGFFFFLEYHKRHFPNLYCLKKKKVGKMVVFGLKPWVNPCKKMSIFRLFKIVVFIAQKGVFSFQNIMKDIFLAYIA